MDDSQVAAAIFQDEIANPAAVAGETAAASLNYVGKWNRLISTTNWEKGAIITQWRSALEEQGLPVTEYSDETWAQLVGGVSGQHVGRLRRVFQRFAKVYEVYTGLYWSHFQAAVDWNDAEMWLEGARQSKWSVSEMRSRRWETLGSIASDKPQASDIVATEPEEDFRAASERDPHTLRPEFGEITPGPLHEGPDFGDDGEGSLSGTPRANALVDEGESTSQEPTVRPFENLPDLPDDVAEAFESFKLAILRHKAEGWEKISRDDLLASLDSLKLLVAAPADDAPF